jgi:tetratricopeptide (TPR) repeat protein
MEATTTAPTALSPTLPEYLARPEFAQLAVLLRHTPRGAFIFALYNTVPARDGVVAALRELVAPLPVFEYTLHPGQRNPLGYLERLPPELHHRPAVIFIYDLERISPDEPATAWAYLDTQRENLSAHPHNLVFWVTEKGARDAARHAPNTWSQRSGVFDFTVAASAEVSRLRAEAADQPVHVDSLEDLERLTRLYTGLLEEYKAGAEAAPALLADLHGKVAYLLYRGNRFAEARVHAQAQLDLSRELGDRRREAEALYRKGEIERLQNEYDAALASYAQALQLFRAVGDKLGEAYVLQAIGAVQQFRDDRDAALASYAQALQLFRAVGAKLGEANVLKAIGDVQQFRDDRDAALASYAQALQLFRAVGAKLGEANVLQAIGAVQQFRDDRDAALASYAQALQLFRAVGAKLGEANALLSLGDLKRGSNDPNGAKEDYGLALNLYRAIGDGYSVARALYRLGDCARDEGNWDEALAAYQEAVKLWQAIGADNLIQDILKPRLAAVDEKRKADRQRMR